MSELVKIETGSDDIVEIGGVDGDAWLDEISTNAEDGVFVEVQIGPGSDGRAVVVGLHYATPAAGLTGVWRATVGRVDEDVSMLPVTMSAPGEGYEVRVDVACQARTPVVAKLMRWRANGKHEPVTRALARWFNGTRDDAVVTSAWRGEVGPQVGPLPRPGGGE